MSIDLEKRYSIRKDIDTKADMAETKYIASMFNSNKKNNINKLQENNQGRKYIIADDVDIPISIDDYIEYKNIEKELGIDLITLFKALKNGIYYRFTRKGELTKMKKPMLRVIDNKLCLIAPKWITTTWMNINLKDYGKTWALTKEELL